eukprot:3837529-Amphidinium_carterae.1
MSMIGVRTKLDLRAASDWYSPPFCSFHVVSPLRGGHTMGPVPDLMRLITRFGYTLKFMGRSGPTLPSLARLKALSLLATYSYVPLVGDMARAALILCPRGRVTQGMLKDADLEFKLEHSGFASLT